MWSLGHKEQRLGEARCARFHSVKNVMPGSCVCPDAADAQCLCVYVCCVIFVLTRFSMAMRYQAMRSDVRASAPSDARRACERTKEISIGSHQSAETVHM
jgi:hypothetical protein